MKKLVKNIGGGGTLGITFNSEDRKVYNIELGDIIEVDTGYLKVIKKISKNI